MNLSANEWADFWYYRMNLNLIPMDSRNKKPIVQFKQYQNARIPEEVFEGWKKHGLFDKGMAVFSDVVYHNQKEKLFWVSIDCDSKDAIDAFCKVDEVSSLKELSEKNLVEQHEDDVNRAHISFFSPVQFPSRSASGNKLRMEIKGSGGKGLMIVSPSIHKNGYPYKIIWIREPITLKEQQANEMIRKLNHVFVEHDTKYLKSNKNSNRDASLREMTTNLRIKYGTPSN